MGHDVGLHGFISGSCVQKKQHYIRGSCCVVTPESLQTVNVKHCCLHQILAACLPLILRLLLFAEDVRSYKFAAFDAIEELQPSRDQLATAEKLVDALDLAQGTSCCAYFTA